MWWVAVAAVTLLGLILRIAAAHGDLWTDEAWSVIYAAEARDALGVFLRINHDNNHHLYSLWLQQIGLDASPLLARAPAIVAGTAAIPVAAIIGARRSQWTGFVAAVLFAFSPALVEFGSEARGYAPMLLAALLMLLLVMLAIEGKPARWTPWWLALIAALGMLSHLTMLAPVALITAWVYLDRRQAIGPRRALGATLKLMGPALGAAVAVLLLVMGAAWASPTGMRIGGYLPFRVGDYVQGLDDLTSWTLGPSFGSPWIGSALAAVVAVALLVRAPQWLGSRARLYAILILGVPLALGLMRAGNAAFGRYYLCSALGLLLLAAECIGHALQRGHAARAAAVAALVLFLVLASWRDSQLIALERGRPGAAVALIAERAPHGAEITVGVPRLAASLALGARRAGLPLRIAGRCHHPDFLMMEHLLFTVAPAVVEQCGMRMHLIAAMTSTPLSGEGWALYQAGSLQRGGPAGSGRAPGASNERQSGRAGVAQG